MEKNNAILFWELRDLDLWFQREENTPETFFPQDRAGFLNVCVVYNIKCCKFRLKSSHQTFLIAIYDLASAKTTFTAQYWSTVIINNSKRPDYVTSHPACPL